MKWGNRLVVALLLLGAGAGAEEEAKPELVIDAGGHTGRVSRVAFSPDGRTVASGSVDGNVCLWRAEDGKCLRVLRGHTGPVYGIAYSPDGQRLVSGGAPDGVRVWDVATGETQTVFKGAVCSIAMSPDGGLIAAGDNIGTIRTWSLPGGTPGELQGHTDAVWSLRFTADGQRLVSGSFDNTVRIWDLQTGKTLHTLQHSGMVSGVDVSPDGRTLATACDGLRFWDINSGTLLATVQALSGRVCFNATGTEVYVANGGLWSVSVEKHDLIWDHSDGFTGSVTVSPDGQTLATGGENGEVALWDVPTRERRWMARSKSATVVYVSLCPTEKEFALATVDGAAARVSLADGAFLPWRGQRGDHPGYVPIVYSPDGLSFAFATVESPLVLFDSLSGRPVRTFPGARTDLRSLAFSRDGKVIANGHYNEIQIWDVASGDLVT